MQTEIRRKAPSIKHQTAEDVGAANKSCHCCHSCTDCMPRVSEFCHSCMYSIFYPVKSTARASCCVDLPVKPHDGPGFANAQIEQCILRAEKDVTGGVVRGHRNFAFPFG